MHSLNIVSLLRSPASMYVILSTLVYSAVQYTAIHVEGVLVWRPQVLKDNIHLYKINNPMNKREVNV